MLDHENELQQEALGIVGVNLLYAAFFLHHKPELMLESLLDNLTTERIEIDMIEFSGIEFRHVDNRVMSLKLVQLGLSGAAMFGPSGEVLQPSEVLRKRPILVERGSFRPVTKVNIDMITVRARALCAEPEVDAGTGRRADGNHHAKSAGGRQNRSERFSGARRRAGGRRQDRPDFGLLRILSPGGIPDALHHRTDRRDHGRRRVFRICSTSNTTRNSKAASWRHSASYSLKICGSMFIRCVTRPPGNLTTVENSRCPRIYRISIRHLVDRGRIKQLDNFDESVLHIFSRDVLKRIKDHDTSWEGMVPPEIAEVIKRRQFFGYREVEVLDGALVS